MASQAGVSNSPQKMRMVCAQAIGLFFTPESPVWLEWKGRKAMAMYNQHRLLGPHWQEEGEVGDLEQVGTQPLNGESDNQVELLLTCQVSLHDRAFQHQWQMSMHPPPPQTGDLQPLVAMLSSAHCVLQYLYTGGVNAHALDCHWALLCPGMQHQEWMQHACSLVYLHKN